LTDFLDAADPEHLGTQLDRVEADLEDPSFGPDVVLGGPRVGEDERHVGRHTSVMASTSCWNEVAVAPWRNGTCGMNQSIRAQNSPSPSRARLPFIWQVRAALSLLMRRRRRPW
jgi:hypothetical protein